jgi:sterol desaturase/sphingolipid hydroxylase (fatty acid hydroxylase superfamily)
VSFSSLESFWLPRESILLWGVLLVAFTVFAVWETLRPRRALTARTGLRWVSHAVLWFLSCLCVVWIYRGSAVVLALAVSHSPYGLLNREIVPIGVRCVIAVLLLDFVRYGQHYLYHSVAMLWRIHRVHHGDPDYDWSTGLRFHPVEVLLTQGSYLAVIAIIAPPPLVVLGLELMDGAVNFFSHANVAVPPMVETQLRRFLITPDMHRIHHSDDIAEQNSNFGILFPWWDRLFGTYLKEPAAGQDKMRVGLREPPEHLGMAGMLARPFRS